MSATLYRTAVFAALASLLAGCGTATTLGQPDREVAAELRRQNTYCESLPRVYSGVSYNVCKLNSKRSSTVILPIAGFYVFDTVLSSVTDTVVLPFTIYSQNKDGNLRLDVPR
ncbi:YceK/YidQ family lipoprotein [Microbulbifer sp. YPW16]|uniref:YceK/YidQ family lipoprotein n=1 Tax=Microbulbifer sp. YPW16 TaxID=2904242 RepID=UPI001E4CFC4F|nr:YceK/YidQ family lipoprotein [Microbulbifer sp. YPW16]UHQ55243.1 YceK/YidQ family lipoprotein [Microbulbifer sp. YPW16]